MEDISNVSNKNVEEINNKEIEIQNVEEINNKEIEIQNVEEIINKEIEIKNIENLSINVDIKQITNNISTDGEDNSKELVEGAKELIEGAKELVEGAKIIAESAKIVAETNKIAVSMIGLDMIKESKLSDEHKKIAEDIYDSLKPTLHDLISDPNIDNSIKVTKVIAQIIKKIENTPKKVDGIDKKEIAIQLGRSLIKDALPDSNETEILMIYDLMAESTLEAMIEVSKVVNVVIQEVATKCCPSLLELFKKAKISK